MQFLVDQCVYHITVRYLRNLGHDLVTAEEMGLECADDSFLLAKATELNRVFLTRDLDFADLRRYSPASTAGIIVLRMKPATLEPVHLVLYSCLASGLDLTGALVIVDQNKYRVRRL